MKVLRAMWSTYNIILPYLVLSLNEKHTKAAHQPEAQNFYHSAPPAPTQPAALNLDDSRTFSQRSGPPPQQLRTRCTRHVRYWNYLEVLTGLVGGPVRQLFRQNREPSEFKQFFQSAQIAVLTVARQHAHHKLSFGTICSPQLSTSRGDLF